MKTSRAVCVGLLVRWAADLASWSGVTAAGVVLSGRWQAPGVGVVAVWAYLLGAPYVGVAAGILGTGLALALGRRRRPRATAL